MIGVIRSAQKIGGKESSMQSDRRVYELKISEVECLRGSSSVAMVGSGKDGRLGEEEIQPRLWIEYAHRWPSC